jgi:glutathione S-transferase
VISSEFLNCSAVGTFADHRGVGGSQMLILYHHGSSVCAAKVRIVLGEKKMQWEGRYVDILKGEQFAPEFRKLNPKSVVPVLDRDKVVTESTVICEYLEETHSDQPVFPTDPYLRAGGTRASAICSAPNSAQGA